MVKWIDIKRNELPTSLIPYKDFDEELDMLMITNSLLGWTIDISYTDTIRDRRYCIQFNNNTRYNARQVNIMIYFKEDETQFRSMSVDILATYGTDFYSDVAEHYDFNQDGKTTEEIKQLLKVAEGILNLGNN